MGRERKRHPYQKTWLRSVAEGGHHPQILAERSVSGWYEVAVNAGCTVGGWLVGGHDFNIHHTTTTTTTTFTTTTYNTTT